MFLCSLNIYDNSVMSTSVLFLVCHVRCRYRWILMCMELFFEGLGFLSPAVVAVEL